MRLSTVELDAMVAEAIVDACDEYEQLAAFQAVIEDRPRSPSLVGQLLGERRLLSWRQGVAHPAQSAEDRAGFLRSPSSRARADFGRGSRAGERCLEGREEASGILRA
jgi:hypothetical protein